MIGLDEEQAAVLSWRNINAGMQAHSSNGGTLRARSAVPFPTARVLKATLGCSSLVFPNRGAIVVSLLLMMLLCGFGDPG